MLSIYATRFPRSSAFYKLTQTLCLAIALFSVTAMAQAQEHRVARDIADNEAIFPLLPAVDPFALYMDRNAHTTLANASVNEAIFLRPDMSAILQVREANAEFIRMNLPFENNRSISLKLKRADILTPEFKVTTATGGDIPFDYQRGAYYWGVVDGVSHSLVALAFSMDEVMGFITMEGKQYTLGKLDKTNTHILYQSSKLKSTPGVNCFVDDEAYTIGRPGHEPAGSRDASNCVRMYLQVDYDLFVAKGGVQQAADYVNGAFVQVAQMYANESINFAVNEIFVWNTADPFTGPTTSNYLTQFRNYLNGNFNGDLAHLVGINGGGGIAYIDVLCNGFYSVAYSAVNLTYNNVPTYSWTIMVLTHEIGHNLGSPHTHACAWNGNNTAIDGCGPAAGYSEGCNGPVPSAGTVMSYCHLVSSIDMALGFGEQPGDLVRSRTYNASCLTSCGPPVQNDAGITAIAKPIAFPCENSTAPEVTLKNFGAAALTSVTIQYQLDNGANTNYNWTGNLPANGSTTVTLTTLTYGTGSHLFEVRTLNPNGQPDENTSNDESSKNFTYHVNWCTCASATANITPNPLTHSGSGSSQATFNLGSGSKRPQFTISNLNAKTNGPASGRFVEAVNVSYVDYYGVTKNYGTFYGNQQSTVNVNIQDMVNTITITLSNNLNNGYSGTLSINFGSVTYCGPEGGCPDADGDGVCDDDDQCPGQDDDLAGDPCDDGNACTENDVYSSNCTCAGTPIFACGCSTETDNFNPNPLNHTGAGSTTSVANLDAGNSDATYTISGLGARTGGNPNGRYIERVTVRYVNAANQTITYGVFRGDQQSTVNVQIAGGVQSTSVTLDDAYDGNSATQLSVSMTAVTSCTDAPLQGELNAVDDLRVFPNPASDDIHITWQHVVEKAEIRVFNALGMQLETITVENISNAKVNVPSLGISGNQLLFLTIKADGKDFGVRRIAIQ